MIVSFQNPGVIDLRAVKTFGISVKENENPIGYFGTGLKYAVAILLREGHEVCIYTGTEPHHFGTKPVTVRGATFNVVTLDGDEIGMTLDVGKNWKMWMALRELQSNVIDEGGVSQDCELQAKEGYTTIVVKGQNLYDEWLGLDRIFMMNDPEIDMGFVHLHAGGSQDLYCMGVKAHSLHTPSIYTYDLRRKMELTEDRTIAYSFIAYQNVAQALMQHCDDKRVLRNVIAAGEGSFEGRLPWADVQGAPSKLFLSLLDQAKRSGQKLSDHLTAVHIRNMPEAEYEEINLSAAQAGVIENAVTFLTHNNFDVSKYPIKVASDLGQGVLGRAKDDTIWLSSQCLMMGSDTTIGTLFEEYVHLEHKYSDMTRGMQNFLIETIVSLMRENML